MVVDAIVPGLQLRDELIARFAAAESKSDVWPRRRAAVAPV